MGTTPKNIFIVAGEASGDAHAAHLVQELLKLRPDLKISGLGGAKMRLAGVQVFYDLTQIAVVGFFEVWKNYPKFKKIFDDFLKEVDRQKPSAVILVDYPGFNLRLAEQLKKRHIKVVYYISPQIWAWKESRVELIKKYVDYMLVLFRFEVDFYRKHNFHVECVGHPSLDHLDIKYSRKNFLELLHLPDNKLTVGLLPGSRQKEVHSLLPVMLETARELSGPFVNIQFIIIQAQTIPNALIEKYKKHIPPNCRVVGGEHHSALNACEVCIVASGTATLETAIFGKPMVVVYKTSPITYFLAKMFVKIPNIALVNIVAGKRIVAECIQDDATPKRIAEELKSIITNEIKLADIKLELKKVRESLGEPGASRRAAEKVVSFLHL